MFTMRRQIVCLALIALAVPFPALALDGGEESGGPAGLSVSASLAGCGLAGNQILCQIDAGWSAIEDADAYRVSVIGADGGVTDHGETSGLASSVWVSYAGPGTYTVQLTAWGTPPGETKPEVIATETAEPAPVDKDTASSAPPVGKDLNSRDTVSENAPPVVEERPATKDETACEERVAGADSAAPPASDRAPAPTEAGAAAQAAAVEPPVDPACP